MKVKYIKNIAFILLAVLAFACSEELERANYVGFQGTTVDIEAPLTGTASNELNVYTLEKSGSDRTFNILVDETSTADPASYTVPSSVTVPANSNVGTFMVQAGAASIGKKIVLAFEPSDNVIVGKSITVNINEQCLENLLFLDIKFDIYCEEFAWQIWETSSGDFIAGNEDFGEYPRSGTGAPNPPVHYRLAQIRERICLPAGSYTFAAYDAYGDGLSDGTNLGWFALRRVSDGATLASGQGSFEDGKEFEFILP